MSYYIKQCETVWTVGKDSKRGHWLPDSDHNTEEAAEKHAAYLNGGWKTARNYTFPGYCDHCEEDVEDLIPRCDPWGKPEHGDYWCSSCEDNYDGGGVLNDLLRHPAQMPVSPALEQGPAKAYSPLP